MDKRKSRKFRIVQNTMYGQEEEQKVWNCTEYNAWTRGRAESIELYRIQCIDKRKSRKQKRENCNETLQEKEQKVRKQNCGMQ